MYIRTLGRDHITLTKGVQLVELLFVSFLNLLPMYSYKRSVALGALIDG